MVGWIGPTTVTGGCIPPAYRFDATTFGSVHQEFLEHPFPFKCPECKGNMIRVPMQMDPIEFVCLKCGRSFDSCLHEVTQNNDCGEPVKVQVTSTSD